MARAVSAAPVISSREWVGALDSGRARAPRRRARAATGMLTQKMVRHPHPKRSAATSAPPRSGPATAARPCTAPKAPKALAWPGPSKEARMMPKTWGTIRPAASPCTTRAAMRVPAVGARAHRAEATANPARLPKKTRRRP